ncbi:MAG: hypothetical protein KatS3mg028_0164 [Bacteroidia bacterium]|nr:MAG: hypothetical protein KatS3mg028_0164 [Bacteroidia bacterium]
MTEKTFLHISTLDDRQKNISGILRAFADIEKQGHDFQLIIIGGKGRISAKRPTNGKITWLEKCRFQRHGSAGRIA